MYLQFADDSLLICEAEEVQVKNIKSILLCFEAILSMKVNFFKSGLLGVRVDDRSLHMFAEIWGCKVGSFPTTYLGLPLCLARIAKSIWNLVLERVEKKLSMWKAGYLSLGGGLTLINVVLSNLPIY